MSNKTRRSKNKKHKQGSKNTKTSQQNSTKKSRKVIELVTLIATIIVAYISYIEPRTTVNINHDRSNILNTDFIFTNEGYFFTLYGTKVEMQIEELQGGGHILLHKVLLRNYELLYLGDINPKQYSTLKIPASVDSLESTAICLHVRYKMLFAFFEFNKEQKFGFFVNTKEYQMDRFIRKECKYN